MPDVNIVTEWYLKIYSRLGRDRVPADGFSYIPFRSIVDYCDKFMIPNTFDELYKVIEALDETLKEQVEHKITQQKSKAPR